MGKQPSPPVTEPVGTSASAPRPAPERITFVVSGTDYRPTRFDTFTRAEYKAMNTSLLAGLMFWFASVLVCILWRIDVGLVLFACAWACVWNEAKLEGIAWRRAYTQSAHVIAALATDEAAALAAQQSRLLRQEPPS